LTFLGPELVPKRLELLEEALPKLARVAVLWHPGAFSEQTSRDMRQRSDSAARTLGLQLRMVEVKDPGDLDQAFATMSKERAGASSCSRARCSSTSAGALPISR
jgi:hypothetical protein